MYSLIHALDFLVLIDAVHTINEVGSFVSAMWMLDDGARGVSASIGSVSPLVSVTQSFFVITPNTSDKNETEEPPIMVM